MCVWLHVLSGAMVRTRCAEKGKRRDEVKSLHHSMAFGSLINARAMTCNLEFIFIFARCRFIYLIKIFIHSVILQLACIESIHPCAHPADPVCTSIESLSFIQFLHKHEHTHTHILSVQMHCNCLCNAS